MDSNGELLADSTLQIRFRSSGRVLPPLAAGRSPSDDFSFPKVQTTAKVKYFNTPLKVPKRTTPNPQPRGITFPLLFSLRLVFPSGWRSEATRKISKSR